MSLVRVPDHRLMESPASWFTRVALSQFTTTKKLRLYCGLGTEPDLDMSFGEKSFESVAISLGVDSGSFAFVDKVLSSLRLVDRQGRQYLLGGGQAGHYRFCPACLATDKVKYFRIEWRFRSWLWCPLHMCCLSDACPTCGKPIHLPRDLITAGPKGWGVASLDRCLKCDAPLTEDADARQNTLDFAMLTEWEQCLLRNGRAVLATLLHGRFTFRTEEASVRRKVKELASLEKQGVIPLFADIPDWLRRSDADG